MSRLILTIICGCFLAGGAVADPSATIVANKMSEMLKRDSIKRVRILNVPRRLDVIYRIQPSQIETFSKYKLEMTDIYPENVFLNLLSEAIEECGAGTDDEVDCRWQIMLRGVAEEPLFTIYCDGFLQKGTIDGRAFLLGPKFRNWIKKYFLSAFDLDVE